MTRKNSKQPGRAPSPPPGLPGLRDTVVGLPEGTRALAWDGGTRYLVTDGTTTRGRATAWVVDTATGDATPHLSIESVLVQTDPDEWLPLAADADWLRKAKP